ncbi:hypothetical protein [Sphingomonas sp.]|uniref:hypothetical protein n=1 Tax=Sphingomonas sp. TaxID=28214 RepID=UPI001B0C8451|nr:hypothetical protein [Sphingomonas sp.]MBO9713522.1 hypothetical protein [Sphingomonas sp.]
MTTTPYDTALRIERRELDAIKLSISVEVELLRQFEDTHATLLDSMKRERAVASATGLPGDGWATRMRSRRGELEAAARMSRDRLAALRENATEAYGKVRAIETAAETWQEEAERAASVAEQAQIDDISGARIIAKRRREPERTA